MSQSDAIFSENRELTPKEYKNLSKKVNGGYIPVNYLRKNLFNATISASKELIRLKTIYDDGTTKLKVNRSLHQKHRDLLSILFSDNNGVSKPSRDGGYYIKTNLYKLAKAMGYGTGKKENSKYKISSATPLIEKFLNDLQSTLIIVEDDRFKYTYQLIGESLFDKYNQYDKEVKNYIVKIPPLTAKYHIFNWGVQIPKEINRDIVAIPNKLSKLKALVSFILSNKALKNGVSFNSVCDKLDILDSPNKSRFKKQIRENQELLNKFKIKYDEERKIFYYENIKEIDFEKALNSKDIDEEIRLKEIGSYEILIGEKVRFSTPMEMILLTITSVKVKADKFVVVGKDEKGYEVEFPYTKEKIRQFIQKIKDTKLGLKEIDILKRDFLNRPFKQNIQSSMGGLEEAIFEILDFKATDDENRFIAVIKHPNGTVNDSTSPIDKKLLLGLNWV
jgi:hypothetical protein